MRLRRSEHRPRLGLDAEIHDGARSRESALKALADKHDAAVTISLLLVVMNLDRRIPLLFRIRSAASCILAGRGSSANR
jgi:hypothetical protein